MLVLAAAAKKQLHRGERRSSGYINNGDFVIHRREPWVAGHQNRAECHEHDGYPGFTSEAPQQRGPRRSYCSVMWLRNQVDADATGEKDLGQVRELLLNSCPLVLSRDSTGSWYHLCGTGTNLSLKNKGRP